MAEIEVIKDGPLHVTGVSKMERSDGTVLEAAEEVWLCRCGKSGNKPFCDGEHKKVGFSDES
jgi:CDGSH-type Zn-finger protein